MVIEEVSGIEYKTYIDKYISKPLGMIASNSSLCEHMQPLLAKSYDCNGEQCLYWKGFLLKRQSELALPTYSQKQTDTQDLILKGRAIEKKLIQGNRFPELNY
jgi:CubicO group peptidase (beta-lactamase class C family)